MNNKKLINMFHNQKKYVKFPDFLDSLEEYPCKFCKDKPCGEDHCDRNKEYENESNIETDSNS